MMSVNDDAKKGFVKKKLGDGGWRIMNDLCECILFYFAVKEGKLFFHSLKKGGEKFPLHDTIITATTT
jgi:hypothetical protein